MWAPGLAALLITGAVVAVFGRKALRVRTGAPGQAERPVLGLGLLAVVAAALLVVLLRSPALPVLAIGLAAVGARIATGRERPGHAIGSLGLPVLVGLFGVAVALGTLGRVWTGPASLLSHLDTWGTAVVAALISVLINNLPAASLLAAHRPPHPYALLIGLNVGPNLFVSGSLAWFLWLRAARAAGARPSLSTASRMGVVAVPLALTAAVGLLVLLGTH
jgi:arsenical pump membrane protein